MRIGLEHLLRGIVIAALAVMLWQSLQEPTDSGRDTVRARRIGEALEEWSALPTPPAGIHVELDNVPPPLERAWLGALAGARSAVTWSGDVPAVMMDAQPIASPTVGTRVLVAASRGSSVVIGDEAGAIDTVQTQFAGATLAVGSAAGPLTASAGRSTASTAQGDSVLLQKVLVIGNAGWESKFVVAALEEDGWAVDAFIRVAPGVDVMQGSTAVIDTSRYSAVLALDGAAAPYANRIIEFVRTGGGVVLAPHAASSDALSSLRSGALGRTGVHARAIEGAVSVSLATLSLAPITSLRVDAVRLERRGQSTATAARRVGAGRVLQLGYEDTWRWRLGGEQGAARDHRIWWTELVSSAAYAPRFRRGTLIVGTDPAPMLGLVAAIGLRTRAGAMPNPLGTQSDLTIILFLLLALGLIGEAASRRTRGAS